MKKSTKIKIGIVGLGYVGGAVRNWFESQKGRYGLFYYDKFKEIGSVEELNKAEIIFVAVPTPFNEKRQSYDDSAIKEVLGVVNDGKVIVIKSTILPGSTDLFQKQNPNKTIVFNPEFLRASTANKDFLKPDRQIVGYANSKGKKVAETIIKILPKAPYAKIVRAKEAEMIKYFSNTYLATRVVFANHIYDVCEKLGGVNYEVIRECLVQDKRIGNSHFDIFHEGYRGYSGGCFPKDVKAFLQLAKKLGVKVGLIQATDKINTRLIKSNPKKISF